MQYNLIVVLMGLFYELTKPRHNILMELIWSTYQVCLSSKIITEEKTIHKIPCFSKKTLICLIIEFANTICSGLYNLWMGVHLDQIVFHAKKIHEVVIKTGPESACPINISRLTKCL